MSNKGKSIKNPCAELPPFDTLRFTPQEAALIQEMQAPVAHKHRAAACLKYGIRRQLAMKQRDLRALGLVGCRRISAWMMDSFASLDGRFRVLARDERVEGRLPYRLSVPGFFSTRYELWSDGRLVAESQDLAQAINWLVLKVKGRQALNAGLFAATR